MSIDRAEQLKQQLTDHWVVVDSTVPELRRFAGWTGRVKTVNMNGRALVEFDGPADVGWYDIDPAFLTLVDGPRPKAPPISLHAQKAAPAAPLTPTVVPAPSSPPSEAGPSSPASR